ncbi:MAG: excinuclease ABC subunit A [Deltaproteobacteria bacterium]|nr:excinuclease ABC subunit A [Deltaproteobacteria bacterium]
MAQTEILIENARSHNLKGVDCRIPLRSLTVITGVSGSGKSTLAFDTLYAEGQRRYVSSLSTYARQFLERLPRPAVDRISSLPPAIAIEQVNRVTQARSTVGSASEVLDALRLFFAKLGRTRCPDCDLLVERGTVPDIAQRILERFKGQRILIGVRLPEATGENLQDLRDRYCSEGFTRMVDASGAVVDWMESPIVVLESLVSKGFLLIDRLAIRATHGDSEESRDSELTRLSEAIAAAFMRGEGELIVALHGEGENDLAFFRQGFACQGCGRRFPNPEPARLSFNSPLGACEACQGFGRQATIDWGRVVPDQDVSLKDHAIAPFATPMGRSLERDLLSACEIRGVPVELPWSELEEADRAWVLEGDEEGWYGVQGFFDWLEGRRYKVQSRVLIARYRTYILCDECEGSRLCPEARSIEVAGVHVGELSTFDVASLAAWIDALELTEKEQEIAGRLPEMLQTRVATLDAVGLGYISLDRPMRTLSGGEAQRIQLATALGGGLTASLYVLDEPSVGLHSRDMRRLIDVLMAIRDQGNTVVVVEHAVEILAAADHVIDLGPGAGRLGGQLLVEGSLDAVRGHPSSETGKLLRGEFESSGKPRSAGVLEKMDSLRIVGARANNLKSVTVNIPLHCMVAVTGVSGAGKSTLIQSVLVGNLADQNGRRDPPGECDRIEGAEKVSGVVVVDQTPAVRSARSNPATVCKAFDGIRQRFAATRQARALGVGPGWFSFNVPGGRCDSCEGSGEVVVDMQFLDNVHMPCDACGGRRYRKEVLSIKLDGRSVVDVLEMTIREALEFFAGDTRIESKLAPLSQVGLSYLTLGQPLSTLSGGEHQRIRLALALTESAKGRLYVFDEPTTGLHASDVQILLGCLAELIDQGGSVIVVEHNLDLIRRADWVIDVGPEGGPGGGEIVAEGPPEDLMMSEVSYTAEALRA